MEVQNSQAFSQQVKTVAKDDDKKSAGPQGQLISDLAHQKNAAKKQLNAAILESTINVSASGSPQSLVLKAALEGINEALQGTLGDNAIQTAYDAGVDVSPEATADRIVSLSTAFFSQYQDAHPELSEEEAVTSFTKLIGGGIDQGFGEARDILQSLEVLSGTIETDIDKTYDLVQQGLQAFIDSFKNSEEEAEV